MRNKVLSVRLSDSEHARIAAKAEKAGLSLSDYVRGTALKGKVILYDTKDVYGLKSEIAAIGRNINQVTKVVNSTGEVFQNDIDDLNTAFEMITEILANHMEPLTGEEL